MKFNKSIGYFLTIIFTLIPVIYLILFIPTSFSFDNFSSSMRTIGKVTGIIGMVLFSLTMFLNTRLKITEKLFFGLDKTYKSHHNIGTFAFVFLLFHPIFLASQYIVTSFSFAFKFLIPFQNSSAIDFGIISLMLMFIFLFITFYGKLKYHNWKFTHKFMGVAFILASIHVMIIPSDVTNKIFLKSYMIIFIFIGVFSFIYRTIFWKKFVKRFSYTVTKVTELGGDVVEVTLKPVNGKMSFTPGQFVFISLENSYLPNEQHPFTISSSPNEEELRLSIKSLGDFTSNINNLKVGTLARIEGPFGRFSIDYHKNKKYIWVAGGIGITPFLSMSRSLQHLNFDKIDLFYCFKEENEAIFLKELKEISKKIKGEKFQIHDFCTSKKGYLDLNKILTEIKDIKNTKIFICGPPQMMKSLKEQLLNYGISKENIIMEEFGL